MKRFYVMLAMLLLPMAIYAAEVKIAVIDLEDVFNNYYKTKVSVANLRKQAEVFMAYAKKLNESRAKLYEEFKAIREEAQNLALSKAEQENKRIKAQEKYRDMKSKEAELKQYNNTKSAQLKQERAKMRDRILGDIRAAISKRAALTGYTIVLDKSGKSLSGVPAIIYNSPAIDITQSILKELNRGCEIDKKNKAK